MKKLDDSDVEQLEDFLDETDASKEAMTYQVVKRIFDSIVAPGKRLVWRSAKEWFIEFPWFVVYKIKMFDIILNVGWMNLWQLNDLNGPFE